MKLSKNALWVAALSCVIAVAAQTIKPAYAQGYPERPIRLVAGQAAGGSLDSFARRIANNLSPLIGQPVVVDNRPGAGGMIAEQLVAKAGADGYTLLIDAAQIAVNASIHRKPQFDAAKDLVPVATLHTSPFLVVAGPSLQANSIRELVDEARRKPNSLNFAYTGASTQLGVEAFRRAAGIEITSLLYPGWAKASVGMLQGDVHITIIDVASPLQLIKEGRLRALAIAGERRTPLLPDVPTAAQAGLPGAEAGTWYMIFAPAGTPKERIAVLNREINKVLNESEMLAWLQSVGAERLETDPEGAAKFYRSELARIREAVAAAKIPVQ